MMLLNNSVGSNFLLNANQLSLRKKNFYMVCRIALTIGNLFVNASCVTVLRIELGLLKHVTRRF